MCVCVCTVVVMRTIILEPRIGYHMPLSTYGTLLHPYICSCLWNSMASNQLDFRAMFTFINLAGDVILRHII